MAAQARDLLMFLETFYLGKAELTDKEKLAIARTVRGLTYETGAYEAGITLDGEKAIRRRAFKKLGVKDATELKSEIFKALMPSGLA